MIGVVGVLDDVERHAASTIEPGQVLWLLGPATGGLARSQYAMELQGWPGGEPVNLDLDLEKRVQTCARDLISAGTVRGAIDVTEGGLAVALAELAAVSIVGIDAADFRGPSAAERSDATLFGEAPSRIIVAAGAEAAGLVESEGVKHDIPITRLGVAGGDVITIGAAISVTVAAVRERWLGGLERMSDLVGGDHAS